MNHGVWSITWLKSNYVPHCAVPCRKVLTLDGHWQTVYCLCCFRAQIHDGDSVCVRIQTPVHPHNRRPGAETPGVGSSSVWSGLHTTQTDGWQMEVKPEDRIIKMFPLVLTACFQIKQCEFTLLCPSRHVKKKACIYCVSLSVFQC